MDFLFFNTRELSALMGLPHIQQLIYLKGIRPYMDRNTFMVGVKRRISHKQLAEELYVEPHQGYTNSGSPTRPQIKRAIKGLERAGLVEIHSDDKHLILKCLLADADCSVQNKPVPNPSTQPVRNLSTQNQMKSDNYDGNNKKPVRGKNQKPVLHHNSEKNMCVYVREQFQKFWELYPQKLDESRAFQEFFKIRPDETLLSQILNALQAQIQIRMEMDLAGDWVPKWKFPANWLAQQCWKDELLTLRNQEPRHATRQNYTRKKSAADILAESCKDASFDFDCEDSSNLAESGNVLQFNKHRG